MNRTYRNTFRRGVLAFVTAAALSGCATYVTVSAEGEAVNVYARGSGRSAYRWQQYGPPPATFKVYYNAIQTRVRWADGTISEPLRTSLVWQSNAAVRHERDTDGR